MKRLFVGTLDYKCCQFASARLKQRVPPIVSHGVPVGQSAADLDDTVFCEWVEGLF